MAVQQERRGGWGVLVALILAAVLLWAGESLLLLGIPLALLLLALPPYKPGKLVAGAVLLALALIGPAPDAVAWVERGWALVLGAGFVLLALAFPRASVVSRALGAVGGAAACALAFFGLRQGGWGRIDGTVSHRFRDAAHQVVTTWSGGKQSLPKEFVAGFYKAAELQAFIYPALLALASLAAVAAAWWLYRRTALREAGPLPPLREFRFGDHLIWLLIVGIVLLVMPVSSHALVRTGSNLVTFMGALYALRGVAVLVAVLGTPGLGGMLMAVLAMIFVPPVVVATALLVGVTDTWLDLRARKARLSQGA